MVLRGFSEPYGFWKMYWIWRRVSVPRDLAAVSSSLPPSRMLPVQSLVVLELQADGVQHLDLAVVRHDVVERQDGRP